jgi:hypothetical protein
MTRIKVVPNSHPNADGEWIELPIDLPNRMRWAFMEPLVRPHIPAGHHVVSLERGSRNVTAE